jgi:DNA polymerase-1
MVEHRKLAKLKGTYADGLLKVLDSDNRIHTTYQNTVVTTGRLSSTNPNLQNIPVRSELGGQLRGMFIPSHPDWSLVDADYSQIELRVLAHMAQDERMIQGFLDGHDIHAITASQVFRTPLNQVSAMQRQQAKAVNFGIVFGISPFSLSEDIHVPVYQAREYINAYFETYSGVKAYMDAVTQKAYADGFVTTMAGRRRTLPELSASNHNLRKFGERAALNTPIQGTAAEIIKKAMIAVFNRLQKEKLQARLILQIHDELIVDCPDSEVEIVKHLLQEEMENAAHLDCTLKAEAHAGKTWLEAK